MNILQSAQPSLLDRAWMVLRYPYNLVKNPFEAFLSIPALSFLIIPTFSSYSTSINLLFFYLTWSTLILSNPPLKVEIFGTLAIRVLFYILPSLGFLAFDSAAPKIAVKIKEHGEDALPLSEGGGGKKDRWWKIALVSVGNVLLGVALQAGIELLFTKVLHIRSALKISTSIPLPWSMAIDLVKGLLLREVRGLFPTCLEYADNYGLDTNLPASSLCVTHAVFAPLRLPYVVATFSLTSLLSSSQLRPSSSIPCPHISSNIYSSGSFPISPSHVSPISRIGLFRRNVRLQRV